MTGAARACGRGAFSIRAAKNDDCATKFRIRNFVAQII